MLRKKSLMLIIVVLLASLSMINVPVPVTSPATVTFSVDMSGASYIPGKPVDTVFSVDILVDASGLADDSTEGIVTWGIDVEVDPAVLEVMGATGAGTGYFLKDFLVAHGYQFDYAVSLLVGSIDKAAGYMDEVAESIIETPPTGAGGTGTLVSLWFKSLSETAYSPITISISQESEWQAVYKDAAKKWHEAATVDGHYNQPLAKGSLSGTVTNASSGSPIVGATVSAVGPTPASTTTAGDGTYTLTDLDTGSYDVTASAAGYEDLTKPITLVEGANTLDFALTTTPPAAPVYQVDLVRRSAWPGHHHHVEAKYGMTIELFAIVKNVGTETTDGKVMFTIESPKGVEVDIVETLPRSLAAGEIYGNQKDDRYSTTWIAPGYGKYYVEAKAYYYDPDIEDYVESPDTPKSFSFSVVP